MKASNTLARMALWSAWILLSCGGGARADANAPILRIETGGHDGAIRHLAASRDGRRLVSVGDDKVARVWDLQTRQQQTLRYQISDDPYQTLFSAAISSDPVHPLIAVGDITKKGGNPSILLFDPAKPREEQQVKRLRAAPFESRDSVIYDLNFSPDNQRLVSAGAQVQVWDVASGNPVWAKTEKDGNFAGATISVATAAAFSPDNAQVAAAFADGTVKAWSADGKKEHKVKVKTVIRALAWSQDGRVAFGGADGIAYVWNPATAAALTPFAPRADTITSLAFSPDGQYLLCGGGEERRDYSVQVYDMAAGREVGKFSNHIGTVLAVAMPDNKTAISADASGVIWVWEPSTQQPRFALNGVGQILTSLAWSSDSASVAWSSQNNGRYDHAFHLLNAAPIANLNPPGGWTTNGKNANGRLSMSKDKDGFDTVVAMDAAGKEISHFRAQFNYDRVKAYAWLDESHVVVGSDLYLAVYQLGVPKPVRLLEGHQGGVTALSVSPNGRYLATAGTDQTIRFWDLQPKEATVTPLASLFYGRNNEWIFWVDEGYFACSPQGDRFIGWQVNRGLNRAADFYPAAAYWQLFHRPDVLMRVFKTGSVKQALAAADAARGGKTNPDYVVNNLDTIAPPQVTILDPRPDTPQNAPTLKVRVNVTDPTNRHKVTQVLMRVDGLTGRGGITVGKAAQEWSQEVALQSGDNYITVVAVNDVGVESAPQTVHVTYNPPAPPRPNLYVLAIGVSKYETKLVGELNYADKDARDFANIYSKQRGGMFSNAAYTRVLENGEATRDNITTELDKLKQQPLKPDDYVVVFLAGHGMPGPAIDTALPGVNTHAYYFLPCNGDPSPMRLSMSAFAGSTLLTTLSSLPPCKVILVLDTCRGGSLIQNPTGTEEAKKLFQADDAQNNFLYLAGRPQIGLITFYACLPWEESLEDEAWQHGAFTKAFLEGLEGMHSPADGVVTLSGLAEYIGTRVKALTNARQTPSTSTPSSVSNILPLAKARH